MVKLKSQFFFCVCLRVRVCANKMRFSSVLMSRDIVFRQLVESASSTYTYIIGCPKTNEAVIIDPVIDTVQRDAKYINELGLRLKYGLNTHVHADHITGTAHLKKLFPEMKSVLSKHSGAAADIHVDDMDEVKFGEQTLQVRTTPGHTDGCVTFIHHPEKMAFTGDALLIRSCGRTDFQQGDPHRLYHSVWDKILSLPEEYTIHVGHNYDGVLTTSVREEKKFNPRLTKSEDEFVKIMQNLNLAYPKQIDKALPANLKDGDV